MGKLSSFVTELSTSWSALNLSCNHLRVMPECSPLTALRSLNLSYNLLVALPSSLGQSLAPLRELLLAGNGIQFVAPEIALLSRLEKLDLSSNALSTLSAEFFNMPSLQGNTNASSTDNFMISSDYYPIELILAYNPLVSLPRTVSGMQSLVLLDLAGCALTKVHTQTLLLHPRRFLTVSSASFFSSSIYSLSATRRSHLATRTKGSERGRQSHHRTATNDGQTHAA